MKTWGRWLLGAGVAGCLSCSSSHGRAPVLDDYGTGAGGTSDAGIDGPDSSLETGGAASGGSGGRGRGAGGIGGAGSSSGGAGEAGGQGGAGGVVRGTGGTTHGTGGTTHGTGGTRNTGGTGDADGGDPPPPPPIVQQRIIDGSLEIQRVLVDSKGDVILVGAVPYDQDKFFDGVDFAGDVDGLFVVKLKGSDFSMSYAKIFRGVNRKTGAPFTKIGLTAAALDASDDIYLLGTTESSQLDFGGGAVPASNVGGTYLVKLSPAGTQLGSQTLDPGAIWSDIDVDADGAILAGIMSDSSFTANGVQVPASSATAAPGGAMKLGTAPASPGAWATRIDDPLGNNYPVVRAAAPDVVMVSAQNNAANAYTLSALSAPTGAILWTSVMTPKDIYSSLGGPFEPLRVGDHAIFTGRFYGTIASGGVELTHKVTTPGALNFSDGVFVAGFSLDTGSPGWAIHPDPFGVSPFFHDFFVVNRLARLDDTSFVLLLDENIEIPSSCTGRSGTGRGATALQKFGTDGKLLAAWIPRGFDNVVGNPPYETICPATVRAFDMAVAPDKTIIVVAYSTGLSFSNHTGTFVFRVKL